MRSTIMYHKNEYTSDNGNDKNDVYVVCLCFPFIHKRASRASHGIEILSRRKHSSGADPFGKRVGDDDVIFPRVTVQIEKRNRGREATYFNQWSFLPTPSGFYTTAEQRKSTS